MKLINSGIKARKGDTVLPRFRIGHTRMTHGYQINTSHQDRPTCDICNTVT